MNASPIRDVLEKYGITPSKTLGQNFLVDKSTARAIVDLLETDPQDCIIEVGPGAGALTEFVAPLCRKLILVEFDKRLADYQRTRWADDPHVVVYQADAATWDPRPLFAEQPVKFLGNLPYSAGGAILENFLQGESPCSRAVIMLQKELVERILAKPGDEAYGLLSLRMQMNWEGRLARIVPPSVFRPQPKVDSAVMVLTPRDTREEPVYDRRLMDELMRRCFSCRRKQMRKQMPARPPWEQVCAQLAISPTARPEEVSLSQWMALTRAYDPNPLAAIPQRDDEIFDVVDEADCPVRTATRREVHEQGLIHRAVHILVFNKRGDCLLQKRSLLKDHMPGVWDSSAAGHLNVGEDYLSAAVRELREELGIRSPAELRLIGQLPPSPDTGMEHVHLFATRYDGKVHFPAAEISAVLPFPSELIDSWLARRPQDFATSFAVCWRLARNVVPSI